MLTDAQPMASSLLISEPFMMDPNFKRSVVLLAEHNHEGSIGYVLNQKSNLLLKDVIDECPGAAFEIYVGGPVANNTLHFIHRCYHKINSGEEIGQGVFWGGNFEALKILINSGELHPGEIRFFVGYSGWGEQQLQQELEENSWLVANTYRPELLFSGNEEKLWKDLVAGLGSRFAHIANFPENPMWN